MDNASLISNVLPKLDSMIKQQLLNLLKEKGVETPEDWEWISATDLTPPLKLAEARKLVKKGKSQGTISSFYFRQTFILKHIISLSPPQVARLMEQSPDKKFRRSCFRNRSSFFVIF